MVAAPDWGTWFAEAYLWPYQNAYGMWTECQAQLGWSVLQVFSGDKAMHGGLCGYLPAGYSADQARVATENRYYLWVQENIGHKDLPAQRFLIHCYGDWYARLHGVYTGIDTDSPMTSWYSDPILL